MGGSPEEALTSLRGSERGSGKRRDLKWDMKNKREMDVERAWAKAQYQDSEIKGGWGVVRRGQILGTSNGRTDGLHLIW